MTSKQNNKFIKMEGVAVKDMAARLITPFYCYSKKTLINNVREFQKALPQADICYAVKANSNIAIVRLLASQGCGADVTSRGELMLALKCGIKPSKIVFNGVGKTANALKLAVQKEIKQINIESEEELYALNQIAISLGKRADIAIRVNPDVDGKTHKKITTGTAETKFGIPWPQAFALYKEAMQMKGVRVKGISMHIGSQILTLAPFEQSFKKLIKMIAQLSKAGIEIENIDIGGGIGTVYNPREDKPLSLKDYGALVNKYFKPLKKHIIIEPGRRLVADAGVLISKVLYFKKGAERDFLIIDAGMNDLIRPAIYDSWHEILPCTDWNRPKIKVDVVGSICENSDIFGKSRVLPKLENGEFVAIMDAGAYGASMGSTYNFHPLAGEILVDGNKFTIIRRRKTYEEMLEEQLALIQKTVY